MPVLLQRHAPLSPRTRDYYGHSHDYGHKSPDMLATSLQFTTSDKAVIFDIDGTLADPTHRLHYLHQPKIEGRPKKDWHAFFSACADDPLITDVATCLRLFWELGFAVVLVSGRSSIVREQTEHWLARHDLPHHALFMRAVKDHRPDDIVKEEILLNHVLPIYPRIFAVFDDRDRVVAMWRRHGLRCFQVAPGSF